MDKLAKYYGVFIFVAVIVLLGFVSFNVLMPKFESYTSLLSKKTTQQNLLNQKNEELKIVSAKIKKLQNSNSSSLKKVYYPVESDLGSDTLFFTMYNDVVEMLQSNSLKIRTIDYNYNPANDKFVEFGKEKYFVCDVNMELVSNYVNLGKFIEALYQYPYYIKVNSVSILPYEKDKKFLITNLSIRLYAHTEPEEEIKIETAPTT